MGYAHEYATAIMHRGRVPMEPADYVPNWADGPRKAKHYPGTESLPLPTAAGYPTTASVDRGLGLVDAESQAEHGEFSLPVLADMLLDSYGLTGRRLGVQANTDLSALPHYPLANWSRGTASGGGLYPVSVYWVSGPGASVPPGVHYYSTRQHAMRRLLTGDVRGEVAAALGGDSAASSPEPQYLVLGVKYWQNAFKYNSFSFHAVSMDVGALLGTWRMWARARGLSVEPALWFDEERLARLLGVRGEEEGIFAVVPLGAQPTTYRQPAEASAPSAPSAPSGVDAGADLSGVSVRHRDIERSRTVLRFDTLSRMQETTLGRAGEAPAADALASAAAPDAYRQRAELPLPVRQSLDTDVRTALRRRRSSFGRFDASRPMTASSLAATLAAAHAGAPLGGDTRTTEGTRLANLYAFVNHVDGVAPGAYAFDPQSGGLRLVREGNPGSFLQRNYFLSNYNVEQAAAVIVPTLRTAAVLDAVGDRGYRLVNATVGAIAQSVYTASAALEVGCGVALGFDNISYIEELGLEETGESPLLIMLVGHERPHPADFRYEIA